MRIVDRKTFLGFPNGTIFVKVRPEFLGVDGPMCIKRDTLEKESGDWWYQDLSDVDSDDCRADIELWNNMFRGECYPLGEAWTRDGCFNEKDMFLIYELSDLKKLWRLCENALNVAIIFAISR